MNQAFFWSGFGLRGGREVDDGDDMVGDLFAEDGSEAERL